MRRRVKQLVLIVVVFTVTFLIVTWWNSSALVSYRFVRAVSDARILKSHIEMIESRHPNIEVSEDLINQWLASELPTYHPYGVDFYIEAQRDPWGNPYKFVRDVPIPGVQIEPVGVYSMGRDGVSTTNGDDPDDLNTWDEDCHVWYQRDIALRASMFDGVIAALLTTFICGCHRAYFSQNRTGDPS